jgi:cell shape-determining protein MreC
LNKTRQERDNAQAELAAYKATGRSPQEILGMNKEFKKLQDTLEGMQAENKLLGKRLVKVQTELDRFQDPNKPVYLRADLKGKVLVCDPKWNFVVLNVGEDQGVLEYGQLLVNRDGRLVAKVIVRSVQKDRCIANVMPGWELGPVMEGDLVIPAYPAS